MKPNDNDFIDIRINGWQLDIDGRYCCWQSLTCVIIAYVSNRPESFQEEVRDAINVFAGILLYTAHLSCRNACVLAAMVYGIGFLSQNRWDPWHVVSGCMGLYRGKWPGATCPAGLSRCSRWYSKSRPSNIGMWRKMGKFSLRWV